MKNFSQQPDPHATGTQQAFSRELTKGTSMNSIKRFSKGLASNGMLAAVMAFAVVACGGGGGAYGGGGGGGGGSGGGGGGCDPIYGGNCPPPPSVFTLSALVSDGTVAAASTDAHLRNPWGLAASPTGPMWVTNNHDHTATVYDGTGLVQPVVVSIPADGVGPAAVTGMVSSSSSSEFMLTSGTLTAPARFLFVTQGGALSGWAPTVDLTHALNVYDGGGAGAQYTGLAIAATGAGTQLYAADFHNGRIDIFGPTFTKLDGTGKFVDAQLPAGYAPFNIQAVQRQGATVLVVAYAKRDAVTGDEVVGAGLGVVNIFGTDGALITRLIAQGGQLNAPWGLAVAPSTFGTLSGTLLVGNFGDGRINGFDLTSGAFVQVIGNGGGAAIVTSGLWGISFGNGFRNQPTNVLYIAAGINGEANGLYARIDLGATAPDIVAPTGVAVTAPAAAATVAGVVDVTASAIDNVGVARVVFAVLSGTTNSEIATDTTAPFSVPWNTGAVANGAAKLTATAFDAFGNFTASAQVTVTVNNVPDTVAPVVALTAPAAGDVSGTVTVSANATDNVGVARVEFYAGVNNIGTDLTAPYSVQWNTTGITGVQQLTAKAFDGAGNTTTSTAVPVNVVVAAAPTLAQLQTTIFTPRCSGCHTGGGGTLPTSMNLASAAGTYAALVNVTSQEAGSLKRVLPGDPSSSYLVRKLEGTAGIVGERMPFGGPYLDQPTINQVRDWIQAGAAP
jgi:uncharacterized protein (TIGR03118 family)